MNSLMLDIMVRWEYVKNSLRPKIGNAVIIVQSKFFKKVTEVAKGAENALKRKKSSRWVQTSRTKICEQGLRMLKERNQCSILQEVRTSWIDGSAADMEIIATSIEALRDVYNCGRDWLGKSFSKFGDCLHRGDCPSKKESLKLPMKHDKAR